MLENDHDKKRTVLYLTLLLIGSGLVKFINCGFTNCISYDGVYYVSLAKSFVEGNMGGYLNAFIPPLYPVLITLPEFFIHNLEISGQLLSALAGTGMILLMYIIGKGFFEVRVGLLMALMAFISPLFNYYSAKVMTDMLYGFLYAWAAYTGWCMIKNPSPRLLFLFSTLSALSYYTRPEGVGLLIIIGVWFLYSSIATQKRIFSKGVLYISAATILFLVLISPQIYIIYKETGEWTFSAKTSYFIRNMPTIEPTPDQLVGQKDSSFNLKTMELLFEKAEREAYKNEGGFLGIIVRNPFMAGKKVLGNIAGYVGLLPKTMGFILVIPFILGVCYRRVVPRKEKEELFALLIIVFNIIAMAFFKEKKRHLISILPFLYIWCAIGFIELYYVLKKTFSQKRSWVIASIFSFLVIAVLPQTFRPIRKDGYIWYWGPEKLAGKWIRENIPLEKRRFLSWEGRKVMFYAGIDEYVNLTSHFNTIKSVALKNNLNYFVMNNDPTKKSIKRNREDFFNALAENALHLFKSIKHLRSKHEVLIYQFSSQ